MPVVSLADAPTFQNHGFTFRPLAVPSRGSTELAVWALEAAPGAASERHTVSREEVLVVQEGRISAEIGDGKHELVPGDALIVPPDTPVRLANDGTGTARLTVATSKGMVGVIDGRTIEPPWAR
ncbi:cupin domain-containing protein [Amycolatopsis alkalitolerans]|uniref:Cupin domain-containing protein n=1 Tax=Amycolatopsis alkalitolerans TaxID=2547244 RepID=A0A5C4LUN4_9PSEU|nr:cupin domain-containing protein [Amycolatopsis alkalitolerans]TNC21418.1 cupin domain-containing protein [Amycolatopsis alkalitolerans]